MENLRMQIKIGPELYLKDPDSSELGRKIVSKSIELISDIGFDAFTFKKLGKLISSPESSIYRYFESKQGLLIYLSNWYWAWTEYRLVLAINNLKSAEERLRIAIGMITKPVEEDNDFSYINEILLSQIIFSESLKTYNTKKGDEQNKKGCFNSYKSVVNRISDIILELKPDFEFPHMLASTVIEGAHQQRYFSEHIPGLTDNQKGKDAITEFYTALMFNFLKS